MENMIYKTNPLILPCPLHLRFFFNCLSLGKDKYGTVYFGLKKIDIPERLTFLLSAQSTLKQSNEAFAISKQRKKISAFSKISPEP